MTVERSNKRRSLNKAAASNSEENLYQLDIKGDLNDMIYDSTYKYAVPRYIRGGRGQVLGLSEKDRIDTSPTEGKIELKESLNDESYKIRKAWFIPPRAKRIVTRDEPGLPGTEDFLALGKRKRVSGDDSNVLNFEMDQFSNSDSDYLRTDDEADFEKHMKANEKRVHLSKAVEENPFDIGKWIELANTMINTLPYESSMKAKREIAISVYKRALEANPGNPAIVMKYMNYFENLQGKYAASEKWRNMVKTYPKTLELWIGWMSFVMRDASNFSFDGVLEVLMEILLVAKEAANRSSESELSFIYVFMRVCRYIYEAGMHFSILLLAPLFKV